MSCTSRDDRTLNAFKQRLVIACREIPFVFWHRCHSGCILLMDLAKGIKTVPFRPQSLSSIRRWHTVRPRNNESAIFVGLRAFLGLGHVQTERYGMRLALIILKFKRK
jgi:hypothetical protein